jgi:hypothetical protein
VEETISLCHGHQEGCFTEHSAGRVCCGGGWWECGPQRFVCWKLGPQGGRVKAMGPLRGEFSGR